MFSDSQELVTSEQVIIDVQIVWTTVSSITESGYNL